MRRTLRLIRQQQGVVLNIHDGTELDYTSIKSLHPEVGQIGEGSGKGYECMNSLAVVAADRTVLGLTSQILHVRPQVPKDETVAQRRNRANRESLLWLKAVDNHIDAERRWRRLDELSGPQMAGPLVVDVSDRLSDTFEFLDYEDRLNRKYVIRSQHDRDIRVGHDDQGAEMSLYDYLRTLPDDGSRREVNLSEREKRPGAKRRWPSSGRR